MLKAKDCQNGQESYEPFWSFGHEFVEYDYQTEDGKLFSCVAATLTKAREKRDEWLKH